MTPKMPLFENFSFHVAAVLLVGTAIAALGLFVLARERGSKVGVKFFLFAMCIALWYISLGTVSMSLPMAGSLWWHKLTNVCVTFVPSAGLALTVTVIQRTGWYRALVAASLFMSVLFSFGVVFSDLFIIRLNHYPWGYYSQYGPLGFIFMLFFFCMMLANVLLYRFEYRRSAAGRHKERLKGMLLAFGVGYLGAVDFIPAYGIPIYPFGYIPTFVFLVIMAYVIMRYRLSDITPELAAGQILETMLGAVIAVDLEGKIRVMNRSAKEILGCRETALLGSELSSLIELPAELRDLRRIREGAVHNHEMIWAGKDGRRRDVSISAAPVTDRGDAPLGVVYVAHDVTERKSVEDQLRAYSAELKQSNEDVLSFAYIVSHDLRAPLVSIKGFTSELRYTLGQMEGLIESCLPHLSDRDRDLLDTVYRKDAHEAMEFIGSSVGRMDGLINAVLTLSRLGRRELKPEAVDMTGLTRSVLNSLAHQIEKNKVSVTVAELPRITADKLSMEQVLGNLLDNALKYLEPGRAGELALTAESGVAETTFHIRDNGRGIAKDDIHKVFEIFRRAGKQDVPGEGMGLAYVQTLVRRHGGRIWCESEPGKGTTFSFTIPAEAQRQRD